ncbi:diguanylate cyclase domain-containing protein [Pseudosporangium ferrugineum]|uniref:GGDEF domain-containing protein n=1 Tax=Pseudosporangium ferrugineum TaxID=439699 RepID=A0A2T0R776_9ACTN|nr:diguanylate cyclase [Pseudosporangium ferrugineum]PRY17008.1 GGDEF domain-containing protein [Pseudosporangium ferrugineum]
MKWNVLFVDTDRLGNRLRRALRAHGISLVTCRRLASISAAFEAKRFDLIIVVAASKTDHRVLQETGKALGFATMPTMVLGRGPFSDDSDLHLSSLPVDRRLPVDVTIQEFVAQTLGLLTRSRCLLDISADTGLPGNAWITQQLQKRIAAGQEFSFAYFDIDRFKSVVDSYGFDRAGDFLRAMSDALRAAAAAASGPRIDIAHIGGDDFLAMCSPDQLLTFTKAVVSRFESAADRLYDPVDLAQGFIEIPNRWGTGKPRRAALVTLSIGVAESKFPGRTLQSTKVVKAVASEMKKVAKGQPGSYVCIDRRRSVSGDGIAA